MSELKEYHYKWLSVHTNRTEDWLREKLKDGFHIHHRDGDHDNNNAYNLVLMEHLDHFRLHNANMKDMYANPLFQKSVDKMADTKLKMLCKEFISQYFRKDDKS